MAEAVCPWWLGYFLANPVRRMMHNPEQILEPYIKENMKVVDIGCGMGFFSLPIAKMVGEKGQVICIDLQQQMIKSLHKKASKAGLLSRIETRICTESSLQIDDLIGEINFILAFAVIHEIPDASDALTQIYHSLKKGGNLLISEPSHHVSKEDFDVSVETAKKIGFQVKEYLKIRSSFSVLLKT